MPQLICPGCPVPIGVETALWASLAQLLSRNSFEMTWPANATAGVLMALAVYPFTGYSTMNPVYGNVPTVTGNATSPNGPIVPVFGSNRIVVGEKKTRALIKPVYLAIGTGLAMYFTDVFMGGNQFTVGELVIAAVATYAWNQYLWMYFKKYEKEFYKSAAVKDINKDFLRGVQWIESEETTLLNDVRGEITQ